MLELRTLENAKAIINFIIKMWSKYMVGS